MAEVISTCSENNTSGNTSGGGQWYVTLTAWEAAAQDRFGLAANTEIVECYNDFAAGYLDDTLYLTGWATTDAVNRPVVRAAAGNGHDGVWGAGFTLWTDGDFGRCIRVSGITFFDIIGLEINQVSTGSSGANNCVQIQDSSTNGYLKDLLILNTTSAGFGIFDGASFTNAKYENIVIKGGAPVGIDIANFVGPKLYGVTVYGMGVGIRSLSNNARSPSYINCVSFGNTTDWAVTGSIQATGSNNADGDGTLPAFLTNSVTGVTTADFVDVPNDFTPVASGLLDDAGVFTPENPTDITGFARSDPPEIGAYEIQGGVVGAVLSLPTDTDETQTTATIGCTTDTAGGTLYWYVSTSATPPSAADLKAGTGAVDSGSLTPTSGINTVGATGLTPSTTYWHYWIQET